MAKYLLLGAVGGPNFGDEVILSAWIDIIKKKDSKAVILCDGYNLDNLSHFVDDSVYTLRPDESIWNCTYLFAFDENSGFQDSWDRIQHGFYDVVQAQKAVHCIEMLSRMDIDQIHIIGGGYLNALWPVNYTLLLLARLVAWKSGSRIIATGLGLLPINKEDISGLIDILSTFDYVDVRDADSYELLKMDLSERLSFSGDDALLFIERSPSKYPLQMLKSPTIVICLQNDLFPGDQTASQIFSPTNIKILKMHGIENVVYAAAMFDDVKEPTENLREQLQEHGFNIFSLNPAQLVTDGFPVSEGGLIITSRYHPHFLAALAGFKGIALSANYYYEIKHNSVKETGSRWPILKKDKLSENLSEAIKFGLTNYKITFDEITKSHFIKMKKDILEKFIFSTTRQRDFPFGFTEIWSNFLNMIEAFQTDVTLLKGKQQDMQRIHQEQIQINSVLTEQLNNAQSELFSSHKDIERLTRELMEERAARELIINSRTWRMTAPIRHLLSRFR